MKKNILYVLIPFFLFACNDKVAVAPVVKKEIPFVWEAANVYFLLTDRFNNGDTSNDVNFERNLETGKLRGFKGGDIKGITQKSIIWASFLLL